MKDLRPVILAGGSGARLWPVSNSKKPKQFLKLIGDKSLFQQTLMRINNFDLGEPIVICSEKNLDEIVFQLKEISTKAKIIVEPLKKNTAPAISLAALVVEPEEYLFVLPSDHYIQNDAKFKKSIIQGLNYARKGFLVSFGVKPSASKLGLGYIQLEEKNFKIKKFIEKPSLKVISNLLKLKEIYWNCGIYIFKSLDYLNEINKFFPELKLSCEKSLPKKSRKSSTIIVKKLFFKNCLSISVDNAVMEKTKIGMMVKLDTKWSDIGSWESIWEISNKDKKNNVLNGKIISYNSKGCFIQSKKKLIISIGVEDIIIVESDDAILISKKGSSQEVKEILTKK